MGTIYETAAQTAKKVRAALKAAFPEIRFSVRSKTYSGGSSIHVSWTDGPMSDQVEKVARVFKGATFDGMTDYKETHGYTDPTTGQHCKGADFIFCERELSDAKKAERVQRIRDHFTEDAAAKIIGSPDQWYWEGKLEARALGLEVL